jgi:hypothetical protein
MYQLLLTNDRLRHLAFVSRTACCVLRAARSALRGRAISCTVYDYNSGAAVCQARPPLAPQVGTLELWNFRLGKPDIE